MSRAEPWGPWCPGLDPAERLARLRALRVAVMLLTGPHGADAARALLAAERDPAAMDDAAETVDRLPALLRRRVLAQYAAVHRPEVRR